jgi:hypothetical protein
VQAIFAVVVWPAWTLALTDWQSNPKIDVETV